LGINRDDVHHPERDAINPPPWPAAFTNAPFVNREDRAKLVAISDQLLATKPPGRKVDLLLVGHSHAPCISWSTAKSGSPVVVVDGGSFSYDQSNLLIAAGNTVAIFDVV
jgi:predicted phosphodiesterase